MANFATQLRRLGLIKESVRGTAETTPTKWVAVTADSEMTYSTNLIQDATLRGHTGQRAPAVGTKDGEGIIKFPIRASDIAPFLHMFLGNPVSTEQSAFVVTEDSNDNIDFKEDAGSELNATIAAGSYAMGATSAVSGSLCAAIKTAMEAVGSGTYAVSYSYTTKKVTIAVSGGASAVQILWKTGANGSDNLDTSAASLLGFTNVDTSSAASVQSDSTTGQFAYQHVFTPASTLQPQSYTLTLDRSLNVLKYNLCNVAEMKISSQPDDHVMVESKIFFKSEAAGSIGSPSYTESEELGFHHTTFTLAGSSNTEVKSWEVVLSPSLFKKRTVNQSQDIDDLLVVDHAASGSFVVYFEDATERDKFIAGTSTSIQLTIAGDTIGGAVKYTLDLLFDEVYYEAFSYGDEDGLLAAQVSWSAKYNNSNTRLYRAFVNNITTSY